MTRAGLLILAALVALFAPHAGAYHAPHEPEPLGEVVFVRETTDALHVAVGRTLDHAEGARGPAVWMPAGAREAHVTLTTSNHLEATHDLARVGLVEEERKDGTVHRIDLASFDLRLEPGRIRVTLVFQVPPGEYAHRAAEDVETFRAFVSPLPSTSPRLHDGTLVLQRVTRDGAMFATPASPHVPLARGEEIRIELDRPAAAPTWATSGGSFAAGLGLGALGVGLVLLRRRQST